MNDGYTVTLRSRATGMRYGMFATPVLRVTAERVAATLNVTWKGIAARAVAWNPNDAEQIPPGKG